MHPLHSIVIRSHSFLPDLGSHVELRPSSSTAPIVDSGNPAQPRNLHAPCFSHIYFYRTNALSCLVSAQISLSLLYIVKSQLRNSADPRSWLLEPCRTTALRSQPYNMEVLATHSQRLRKDECSSSILGPGTSTLLRLVSVIATTAYWRI